MDAAHVEDAAIVVDEVLHAHWKLRYVGNGPFLPGVKIRATDNDNSDPMTYSRP